MILRSALLGDREEASSPSRSQGRRFDIQGRETFPAKGGLFVEDIARN